MSKPYDPTAMKSELRKMANQVIGDPNHFFAQVANHIESLERQVSTEIETSGNLRKTLNTLSRMIDFAQKADDEKSEMEIASSASFSEALAYTNSDLIEQERDIAIKRAVAAEEAHNKVTEMVSRFLVPHRTQIAECWKDSFVECGAVTIDKSYPYGFVAPVKLPKQ